MDDPELEAIRQARIRELQAAAAGGGSKSSEDEGEKKRQQEETRQTLLTQILDNEARERLARISIVKAEKARAVEDLLIRMAQSGQLRGKVTLLNHDNGDSNEVLLPEEMTNNFFNKIAVIGTDEYFENEWK
ncbi:3347_t:CDS:2 [Cetraspora pellucida]|uniref:3347_t:CDS:1 n=1 Tax=Cetraspora pellucida TaxID=1433469 RepID=A0A9N9GN23_9GLOM|nr:3347_t:CDS:2 [Cetraspora pellucida]